MAAVIVAVGAFHLLDVAQAASLASEPVLVRKVVDGIPVALAALIVLANLRRAGQTGGYGTTPQYLAGGSPASRRTLGGPVVWAATLALILMEAVAAMIGTTFSVEVPHTPAEARTRLDSLRRQASLRPESARAHWALAVGYELLKRYPEADHELDVAERIAPGMAEPHNTRGWIRLKQGDLHAAAVEFRRALALAPAYPQAMENLAWTLNRMGQRDSALVVYARLMKVDSTDADYIMDYAQTLGRGDSSGQALVEGRRAVSLEPRSAGLHAALGALFYNGGQFDSAESELDNAVRLAPADVHYWGQLAVTAMAGGHRRRSFAALDSAERLDRAWVDSQPVLRPLRLAR